MKLTVAKKMALLVVAALFGILLSNGIALNSAAFNTARIAGPAVAGVLVAVVGEQGCFWINAVSFLAVIVGLLRMRLPAPAPVAVAAASGLVEPAKPATDKPATRGNARAGANLRVKSEPRRTR